MEYLGKGIDSTRDFSIDLTREIRNKGGEVNAEYRCDV